MANDAESFEANEDDRFVPGQPGIVTERLKLPAQMVCADASLHTDQARRQVCKPGFHLATRPLLTQHDGTAFILTYDVERVLTDIDTDYGDGFLSCLGHGVLLVFGAPCQILSLAGQEHGRTIPLTDSEEQDAKRRISV